MDGDSTDVESCNAGGGGHPVTAISELELFSDGPEDKALPHTARTRDENILVRHGGIEAHLLFVIQLVHQLSKENRPSSFCTNSRSRLMLSEQ